MVTALRRWPRFARRSSARGGGRDRPATVVDRPMSRQPVGDRHPTAMGRRAVRLQVQHVTLVEHSCRSFPRRRLPAPSVQVRRVQVWRSSDWLACRRGSRARGRPATLGRTGSRLRHRAAHPLGVPRGFISQRGRIAWRAVLLAWATRTVPENRFTGRAGIADRRARLCSARPSRHGARRRCGPWQPDAAGRGESLGGEGCCAGTGVARTPKAGRPAHRG